MHFAQCLFNAWDDFFEEYNDEEEVNSFQKYACWAVLFGLGSISVKTKDYKST